MSSNTGKLVLWAIAVWLLPKTLLYKKILKQVFLWERGFKLLFWGVLGQLPFSYWSLPINFSFSMNTMNQQSVQILVKSSSSIKKMSQGLDWVPAVEEYIKSNALHFVLIRIKRPSNQETNKKHSSSTQCNS